MKITDVTLSILRTELEETVIPTHGAVDAMPPLVLVSVSTAEGIDGNYISYLIPAKAVEQVLQSRPAHGEQCGDGIGRRALGDAVRQVKLKDERARPALPHANKRCGKLRVCHAASLRGEEH